MIKSTIDWASALAMATREIEGGISGIKSSVDSKVVIPGAVPAYTTPSGTKLERLFGQLMKFTEADLQLSTREFFKRHLFPAAVITANQICHECPAGSVLETVPLELPGGCIVSQRTNSEKISVRLVVCLQTENSEKEVAREFIAREGSVPESMEVAYDIMKNEQYVVKPPFEFAARLDVLGGFRQTEVAA